MQDLADPRATVADARRLAAQRAQQLEQAGLAAMVDTASRRELEDELTKLEEELARSAQGMPRLANLLRRLLPPGDER